MGSPQIDLSAGFVPKSGGDIDISAGLVPKAAPAQQEQPSIATRVLTSALHGMGFPANPAEFRERAAAEENKTLGERLKEGPGGSWLSLITGPAAPASGRNIPAVAHAAKGAGSEFIEANRAAAEGQPSTAAGHLAGAAGYTGAAALAPVLGGSLAQSGEEIGSGKVAEGVGTALPVVAPFVASALLPGTRTPAHTTSADHIEALTGFIKTTKTDPHITATTALPEARAVAAREGVDPTEFQGRRGGEMVTGKDGIFHKAIQEHRAEYAALRRPVENTQLDTTPIAQAYLDRITPEMEANAPQIVGRLRNEAAKFADLGKDAHGNYTSQINGVQPQPLSQIDDFRVRQNNELDKYEQSPIDKQIRSDVEVKADKAAADAARELVYKTIARNSPNPTAAEAHIRDIQRRQGALIEARRDLTQAFNDASGQQGEAVAGSLRANPEKILTLREKASHLYPSKRGLERSFVREVISPKPLELFNNRLRMMFEGLGGPGGGAVQAPAAPPTTPPITLGPGAPGLSGTTRSISRNGQPIGSIQYSINGDTLTIDQLKTQAGVQAVADKVAGRPVNTAEQLTATEKAEIARQLQQQHPEVKYIEAVRVGGTRGSEGRSVRVPVSRIAGKQVQTPRPPPTNSSSARSLSGPERSAAIATVMSSLKRGDITEQEADQKIQRLNGGGGRKLIRFPSQPGGQ